MKKIIRYILLLIALIPLNIYAISKEYTDVAYKITNSKIDEGKINLYFFRMDGCPHCAEEEIWLKDIKENYNDYLNVYEYEVKNNKTNRKYYNDVKKVLNDDVTKSVPYTVIGKTYFVGFSEAVSVQIENKIKELINDNVNNENINNEDVKIPILGNVNKKKVSIPLVAMILGAVDGFNPCAMWILIFLITMLFNMKDRKKMWILGLTFILTSGIVYLMFMLAWLNLATFISKIAFIRLLIAVIALVVGLINVYKYIDSLKKKDEGCDVVDKKDRKKIMEKIISITHEKKFIIALLGIMVLAASVNIIELMCSIGIPLLFTQILAMNELSTFSYMIYMLIYIFFFLIDDIVIFVISMVTLKVTGLSTKYTKYSHLIGGIIMLIIGLLLIIKPELLMFNF